jgi:hypothetical protein
LQIPLLGDGLDADFKTRAELTLIERFFNELKQLRRIATRYTSLVLPSCFHLSRRRANLVTSN